MESLMRHVFAVLAALITITSAQADSASSANKAVAARVFEDIYNRRDFTAANEIYAPDFVNHGETRDISLAEDLAASRGWCDAFPDLHVTIEKSVAEGDLVTFLWTAEGTNTGAGNGLHASGLHAKVRGITIWRVANGRLVEEWSQFDEERVLRATGAMK
jgi:predicted ester cyclase